MAASATLKAQKCQPLPRRIDEVEHVAGGGAIDQVADRSSQNTRDAQPRQPVRRRHRRGIPGDADQRQRRHQREHDRLARELHRVEHPERRAGVVHARQRQQVRNRARCSRAALSDCRTSALVTWSATTMTATTSDLEAA